MKRAAAAKHASFGETDTPGDSGSPGEVITTPSKKSARQSSPKKKQTKSSVATPTTPQSQSDLEEMAVSEEIETMTVTATESQESDGGKPAMSPSVDSPSSSSLQDKGKSEASTPAPTPTTITSDPLDTLFKTHDLIVGITQGATYPAGVFVTALVRPPGRTGESTAKLCMHGTRFETYSVLQETLQGETAPGQAGPVYFGSDQDGTLPTHPGLVVSFIRDDKEEYNDTRIDGDRDTCDAPMPLYTTKSHRHDRQGGSWDTYSSF